MLHAIVLSGEPGVAGRPRTLVAFFAGVNAVVASQVARGGEVPGTDVADVPSFLFLDGFAARVRGGSRRRHAELVDDSGDRREKQHAGRRCRHRSGHAKRRWQASGGRAAPALHWRVAEVRRAAREKPARCRRRRQEQVGVAAGRTLGGRHSAISQSLNVVQELAERGKGLLRRQPGLGCRPTHLEH